PPGRRRDAAIALPRDQAVRSRPGQPAAVGRRATAGPGKPRVALDEVDSCFRCEASHNTPPAPGPDRSIEVRHEYSSVLRDASQDGRSRPPAQVKDAPGPG